MEEGRLGGRTSLTPSTDSSNDYNVTPPGSLLTTTNANTASSPCPPFQTNFLQQYQQEISSARNTSDSRLEEDSRQAVSNGTTSAATAGKVSNLEPNASDDLYATQKLNNLDLSLDGTGKGESYNNKFSSEAEGNFPTLSSTNPFRNIGGTEVGGGETSSIDTLDCDTDVAIVGLLSIDNNNEQSTSSETETDPFNVSHAWYDVMIAHLDVFVKTLVKCKIKHGEVITRCYYLYILPVIFYIKWTGSKILVETKVVSFIFLCTSYTQLWR